MIGNERSQRNEVPVEDRRQNIDVLVALVERLQRGIDGHLLADVGSVGADPVIIDADPPVRVSRQDGELQAGGQQVAGDVKLADGRILHIEPWIMRA